MNEMLEWLRLQVEWGADAALVDTPQDRFSAAAPPRQPGIRATGQAATQPTWNRAPENTPAARMAGARAGWDQASPDGHASHDASPPEPHNPTGPHGTSARATPHTPPGHTPRGRTPPGRVALAAPVAPYAPVNSATTPDALRRAVEGFEGCPLRATATTTLFPQGPINAPVMFIGDAPDADEDRSGQVFAGANGALLDKMLASIGLQRNAIALACALPWRPPGGRPPTAEELRACLPLLHRAIALFAPQRLVLCGGLATRMLTGETASPARLRGKWRDLELPRMAIPENPTDATPHTPLDTPADTLRIAALSTRHPLQLRASAAARREIWADLVTLTVTLRDNDTNSIKAGE